MATSFDDRKALAAWDRIEALGGGGVWESEMVAISFDGTGITDDDLAVFKDFPLVEILDLTGTAVTDKGLSHLDHLVALTALVVINTQVTQPAIDAFQRRHPAVVITTQPSAKDTVNPFTGKPIGE